MILSKYIVAKKEFDFCVGGVWWQQPVVFSCPPCSQFPLMLNAGTVHIHLILVHNFFPQF